MTEVEIPSHYKALVYDKPGEISTKIETLETPKPGVGEVLINLTHSGVCHSDQAVMCNRWWVCQTRSDNRWWMTGHGYQHQHKYVLHEDQSSDWQVAGRTSRGSWRCWKSRCFRLRNWEFQCQDRWSCWYQVDGICLWKLYTLSVGEYWNEEILSVLTWFRAETLAAWMARSLDTILLEHCKSSEDISELTWQN